MLNLRPILVSVCGAIGVRIAILVGKAHTPGMTLSRVLDILQVGVTCLSLMTNFAATGMISRKVWCVVLFLLS